MEHAITCHKLRIPSKILTTDGVYQETLLNSHKTIIKNGFRFAATSQALKGDPVKDYADIRHYRQKKFCIYFKLTFSVSQIISI